MAYNQEEIAELIELSMDADQEAIAKLALCCEQSPELKQQIRAEAQIAGILDAQLSAKNECLLNHVMQTLGNSTESTCEKTAANISERIRTIPAAKRKPNLQRRKTLPYAIAFLASAAALLFILLNVLGTEVQIQTGPTILAMDKTQLRVNDKLVTGSSALAAGSAVSVESGQAAIQMNDGSIIKIFGPATLQFYNEANNVCQINTGRIQAHVKPQLDGHAFIVNTAHARVKVVGTIFDVRVEDGISFLSVDKGLVEFTNTKTKKQILCHAGESVDSGNKLELAADAASFVVATADTYASHNSGDFQEQTVRGQLRVKYTQGDGSHTRHSFLRFPLPSNIDQVKSVKLQLYATTVDDGIPEHQLEYVEDAWSENDLNWINQPMALLGDSIARWTVRARGKIEISIDPKYLKGRKFLSVRIRSITEGPFVAYVSKEYPDSEGSGPVPPALKFDW